MRHERDGAARLDERAERCAAASVRARREREASMARSAALERSGKASDTARRRLFTADRAGEDDARAGASEESRATTHRALESAKRGLIRRRQPGGTFEDAAICAGLAPEDILVYVERGEGRGNRPPLKASTVAAKQAALWKRQESRIRRGVSQHCATEPLEFDIMYVKVSKAMKWRTADGGDKKNGDRSKHSQRLPDAPAGTQNRLWRHCR